MVVTSDQSAGSAQHVDPVISGAVGDRVWLDTDGDGVQDIGEAGIPNVEVSLRVDDDGTPGPSAGDSVYDTRITGADGDYLFDQLPPGSYWVDVTDATVPAGLVQSPGNIDPPTDPIATAPLYVVATDDVFLTADFGYTSPAGTAVIGDYVWNDIDRDGIQDPTEIGIADVTLELRSAGPDGVFGTVDDVVEDIDLDRRRRLLPVHRRSGGRVHRGGHRHRRRAGRLRADGRAAERGRRAFRRR